MKKSIRANRPLSKLHLLAKILSLGKFQKRPNKRSFSLVETIVAMALFSLVVCSLFTLFWHNVRISGELNRIKQNSEKLRSAHTYLQNVFSRLILKDENHFFYSPNPNEKSRSENSLGNSLVFIFNNGIDRETGFSYDVMARLYVDNNKQLALVIWPGSSLEQSKPENFRKDVLLDNIEEMKIEFWKANSSQTEFPKEKLEKWLDFWEKDYQDLPTVIKIYLKYNSNKGEEEIIFSFLVKPSNIEAIKA